MAVAPTFKQAFEDDKSLQAFGANALSMFALSLYLRLENLEEFEANSVTEGPDDKKIDICYLNEEEGNITIVQSYVARSWERQSAPANKASDLAVGIAWLLSSSIDLVPEHLRSKATEVRQALEAGVIKRVELLFIHNCPESQNVQDELKTAADATRDICRSLDAASPNEIIVTYKEFGLHEIEELYKARDSEILIDGWFEIPFEDYIKEEGTEWKAVTGSIPLAWIRGLYLEHGDRLFSANYRDYLGYARREENINYQISQTAESEPANFWVYNNGITALTHELDLAEGSKLRGISVINGAQTTGALGDSTEEAANQGKALIRIVECRSPEIVDKIIRFNNTQNEIKPADRRSNDSTQRRLRADFEHFGISYIHRRSSLRTPRNAITAAAISPVLCAFHGEPQTAYRNSRSIFTDDKTYLEVFPLTIRAEHIFLVRRLLDALNNIKTDLKRRVLTETATALEVQQYEVLKYSASNHFIYFLIGQVAEEILGRRISNVFEWKANEEVMSVEDDSLVRAWEGTLRALLPHISNIVASQGDDAFYEVPRSITQSRDVASSTKALIASLKSSLDSQFEPLRSATSL